MSSAAFDAVEQTLLLVAEARERAQAASEIASSLGADRVSAALAEADRDLLALHRRILDTISPGGPRRPEQLRLELLQS